MAQGRLRDRARSVPWTSVHWDDETARSHSTETILPCMGMGDILNLSAWLAGQPELFQQISGGLQQEAAFASQASASPGHSLQQSPWAAPPMGKHGSIWSSTPSERCSPKSCPVFWGCCSERDSSAPFGIGQPALSVSDGWRGTIMRRLPSAASQASVWCMLTSRPSA